VLAGHVDQPLLGRPDGGVGRLLRHGGLGEELRAEVLDRETVMVSHPALGPLRAVSSRCRATFCAASSSAAAPRGGPSIRAGPSSASGGPSSAGSAPGAGRRSSRAACGGGRGRRRRWSRSPSRPVDTDVPAAGSQGPGGGGHDERAVTSGRECRDGSLRKTGLGQVPRPHHRHRCAPGMDHEIRITLRLPEDLHTWLTAQAKSARRSSTPRSCTGLRPGATVSRQTTNRPDRVSSAPALLRRSPIPPRPRPGHPRRNAVNAHGRATGWAP
jgi:hypothetical protein